MKRPTLLAALSLAALGASGAFDESSLLRRARATLATNTLAGKSVQWTPYRGVVPSVSRFKGVWNWDGAFHAMALVRWDAELARDQFRIMMAFQGDDGMLPDVVYADAAKGVFRGCTKPPVWGWAVWAIDRAAPDDAFLREAYESLKRDEAFWRAKRFVESEGMFRYDGNSTDPEKRKLYCGWESGWDDSPRWDGEPGRMLPIDLNCWMVLYYRSLRDVAARLGCASDSTAWAARAAALARRIEERLWDEKDDCYYDREDGAGGDFSRVLTPASFMPLFIGTASAPRAAAMARHAKRLEPGWPTVAYDDPQYRPDVYWRGRTWLNVAYFALKGLKYHGYDAIADAGRATLLGWVDAAKDSIRENYNSRTGAPLGAADFGWSAVFTIKFIDDWDLPREMELPAADCLADAAEERARETLRRLTLDEKTLLLAGSGTMTLPAIPRVGIDREWTMSDSSSTVRPAMSRWSWNYEEPKSQNTKLPSLSALAQTWDVEWARRHGEVLGAECRDRGVDQLLGPGVNIMRNPLCGRNWEYLGEDPVLAAKLCVPFIRGVQSYGVAATVKHYCLNNQELARGTVDTHVDERTLNEIYLPAFRAAVKEAGVLSVMTSYNKIDGIWASENKYMQNGILRERWGFRGMLVTDWGGQHSTAFAALNGGGVEMARGDKIKYICEPVSNRFPLAEAVRRGDVPAATVDEMALHTLYVMAKTGFLSGAPRRTGARNTPAHQRAARDEGAESIVLLKNGKGLLPLDAASLKKVLVIGAGADVMQCDKGCSGEGNVPYEVTLFAALANRLPGAEVKLMPFCAKVEHAATDTSNAVATGGHVELKKGEGWCDEAELKAAADWADTVIVFTGTELGYQENMESESRDRVAFDLPAPLQKAMHAILDWGHPRVVVVSRSGSPVGYTWTDKADALIQTSYLGMEEGNSIVDVLLGAVNPCGKLAQTWPRAFADTAVAQCGTYNATNVTYNERFYVGYRWHDFKGIAPQFPFGHGLSYTRFDYGKAIVGEREPGNGGWTVRVDVTNAGTVAGKEVVQLYVAFPGAKVERCAKELKAFAKVALAPGETKTVELRLAPRDLACWDAFAHRFRTDAGTYEIRVGSSSADIRTTSQLVVGESQFFPD